MNKEELEMQALAAKEKVKSLGKVEQNNGRPEVDDRVKITVGLHTFPMDLLSNEGRFYPDGTMIKYRSADGKEIRHFSMVDETNPIDVDDAMKQLINSCVHIYNAKGAKLAYTNIQAFDRFILALAVREATYPNPEARLSYEFNCECGETFHEDLTISKMVLPEFNEHQEKHYDPVEKAFMIPTKSYGTIKATPSTIGRDQIYRDYIVAEHKKGQKPDTLFAELFWIFLTPENQHDKNIVENLFHKYRAMGKDELAFYVELSKRYKVQPVTEMIGTCPSCGKEVHKEITFPNGIRNLFLDTTTAASEFL